LEMDKDKKCMPIGNDCIFESQDAFFIIQYKTAICIVG